MGIVGPNGSGKTTILNILMGLIKPSSGFFKFDDNTRVGMSVSRKGFFDDMTVKNNIFFFAKAESIPELSALESMKEFNIDFKEKNYGRLSAGMKQRVSLLIPFLKHRDIFLLDEPTNHLDIDSILFLRDKILKLKEKGCSFVITSHVFSELEKVCDRILFLKNGRVVNISNRDELLAGFGTLEQAYLNILRKPQNSA